MTIASNILILHRIAQIYDKCKNYAFCLHLIRHLSGFGRCIIAQTGMFAVVADEVSR